MPNAANKSDANIFASDPEALMTEKQASQFLGYAERTLQHWRHIGGNSGPEFIDFGGRVRYQRGALIRFYKARIVKSTSGKKKPRRRASNA